jgi:hypothetical protein
MIVPHGEAGLRSLNWRKARRSQGNGDCVEVAAANQEILVRDSKNPDGIVLGYPVGTWRSFLSSARRGAYDLPSS